MCDIHKKSCPLLHIWGMELLGVTICFANKTSDGFESHILHLRYTLVAKRIRQRSSKALIVSSTLTEGAKNK